MCLFDFIYLLGLMSNILYVVVVNFFENLYFDMYSLLNITYVRNFTNKIVYYELKVLFDYLKNKMYY